MVVWRWLDINILYIILDLELLTTQPTNFPFKNIKKTRPFSCKRYLKNKTHKLFKYQNRFTDLVMKSISDVVVGLDRGNEIARNEPELQFE